MHKFYYSIVIFSLFILTFQAFKCALSVLLTMEGLNLKVVQNWIR